jgi:hypothetical protein
MATPARGKTSPVDEQSKDLGRDAVESPYDSQIRGTFLQEDVAKLAYALWEERGCPTGSPEIDWLAAEERLLELPSRKADS